MKLKRLVSLILVVATLLSTFVFASSAVTSSDYTAEELDSSEYDLRKYTQPFWEGNIVYNEAVYPIKNKDGTLPDFELMYDAAEIISVKSYRFDVTYTEGVDYQLVNGNLRVIPTGRIGVIEYERMHPSTRPAGTDDTTYYTRRDGAGYEYWGASVDICTETIVVTYVHNGTWGGPVPQSQQSKLPQTFSKLKNGEDLSIVVIGDSVSAGAHSSDDLGIAPGADAYPEMMVKALREKYSSSNISFKNTAYGGATAGSFYSSTVAGDRIVQYNPDLVIMCFGMNDSSQNISDEQFKSDIQNLITYTRNSRPNCEILLVSSMYGNRYTFYPERYEAHANVLKTISAEQTGVGYVNPQEIEKYLLDTIGKDYISLTADNMVHPNDYGMRVIAQSILEGLSFADVSEYRNARLSQLTSLANVGAQTADKQADLNARLSAITQELASLTDEWDISTAADAAKADIEAILRRCAEGAHNYTETVVAPTCTDEGYTRAVCSICQHVNNYAQVPAIGGDHIMDSGRQTIAPTYKNKGQMSYNCARCAYVRTEEVPALTASETVSGLGMVYFGKDGTNYMAAKDIKPYASGWGCFEIDVCPLDLSNVDGIPHVAVRWGADSYNYAAAYNFREQRVEIVHTKKLYYAHPTVLASAPYEWTVDGSDSGYNWHKFAVEIKAPYVRIYIDGELILEHSDSVYCGNGAIDNVVMFYSSGEFYMDNLRIADGQYYEGNGQYDPATGVNPATGTLPASVIGGWPLNDANSYNSLASLFDHTGCTMSWVTPTKASVSTASYKHTCSGDLIATLPAGCAEGGYNQYQCSTCAKLYYNNYTNPVSSTGHNLVSTGDSTYSCSNCNLTFTGGANDAPLHEHIMDSGRQTKAPTYKSAGEMTYSCATCAYESKTTIPALTNAPTVSGDYLLHFPNGNNYMQSCTDDVHPYRNGSGCVEFDYCPVNTSSFSGVPYVGVRWTSTSDASYNLAACYNFQTQQVEIVSVNMPYSNTPTVYASAPYSWSSTGGKLAYNWHKFAVEILNTTVNIYIDGNLVLTDTNARYTPTDNVIIIYSNGEGYMDYLRCFEGSYYAAYGQYNPATGTPTGSGIAGYDFGDGVWPYFTANGTWYCSPEPTRELATKANASTGCYQHTCSGDLVATIPAGCADGGYNQYQCSRCGSTYFADQTSATHGAHNLINRTVTVEPTDTTSGTCTYNCSTCALTFTETIHKSNDDAAAIEAFVAAVAAIGDVTLDDEAAVADAYAAYEALSDEAKQDASVISAKATLDNANSWITTSKAYKQRAYDYQAAVANIGTVTLGSKAAIEAAEAIYAEISGNAGIMYYVDASTVATMTAARTRYNDLVAIDAFTSAVAAIGDVTLDDETAVASAYDAYNVLSDSAKQDASVISAKATLDNANSWITTNKSYKQRAGEFTDAVAAIGDVTLADKAAIEAAEAIYAEISGNAGIMGYVDASTVSTLTAARTRYNDLVAIDTFTSAVAAIGDVTLDDEAAVASAYDAYNALSDSAKQDASVISAKATLDNANSWITTNKPLAQKAGEFTDAVAAIGDVTLDDKTAIEAAEAIYAEISGNAGIMYYVDASTVATMTAARKSYNTLVVEAFIADADAASANATVENKARISELMEYYNSTVEALAENVNGATTKIHAMNSYSKLQSAYSTILLLEKTEAASAVNRVNATSLVISDSLAVNYKIVVDPAYEIVRMKFTLDGEVTVIEASEATLDGNGRYVFAFDGISPHLIGETISSVIVVKDSEGTEISCNAQTYSVATYINRKIATDDAVLKTLLAGMVNFADATAEYISYGKTPSDSITDWATYKSAVTESRAYKSIKAYGNELSSPAVQWSQITPILNDAIDLKISVTGEVGEGYRAAAVFGGSTYYYDIVTDGTESYFILDNYSFSQVSSKFVFTVVDANNSAVSNSLTFNVESYASEAMSGADAKLAGLLTALMQYGDAAREHYAASSN